MSNLLVSEPAYTAFRGGNEARKRRFEIEMGIGHKKTRPPEINQTVLLKQMLYRMTVPGFCTGSSPFPLNHWPRETG
jgi:hypothetical protein